MFKGLRTKIESEQKGQGDSKPKQGGAVGRTSGFESSQPVASSSNAASKSITRFPTGGQSRAEQDNNTLANIPTRQQLPIQSETIPTTIHDPSANISNDSKTPAHLQSSEKSSANSQKNKTTNELDSQISRLGDQLRTVIKERDEISRQKEQSYQLIGELEKNLEQHKATNISLETKLSEYELKLKEQKTEYLDRAILNGAGTDNNRSSKAFNPRDHVANTSDTSLSDNVEVLRHEIIELQAQLAKKNRQLKIRQQNLTDMKKALQKEILDHGKTRDELVRLQRQMKNDEAVSICDERNSTTARQQATSEANLNDSIDMTSSKNRFQQQPDPPEDTSKHDDQGQRTSSLHAGHIAEDTISLNAAMGGGGGGAAVQFDRISCLSRSSASVDDFESNDLQHSNSSNNNNKEVSHEYLRNVLFRYMTSTDTETAQHLVKAISVLMDFTPEQLAAIKRSMNGRMSSWLRLK